MPSVPPDEVASEICGGLSGTLGRLLGRGAAKHSYLATFPAYGTVALKVLDPTFSAERLAREVEAMRRCDSEYIGRLFQFEHITVRGTVFPYLIEEFLSGGSLQDWTRQHGSCLREALLYAEHDDSVIYAEAANAAAVLTDDAVEGLDSVSLRAGLATPN